MRLKARRNMNENCYIGAISKLYVCGTLYVLQPSDIFTQLHAVFSKRGICIFHS